MFVVGQRQINKTMQKYSLGKWPEHQRIGFYKYHYLMPDMTF